VESLKTNSRNNTRRGRGIRAPRPRVPLLVAFCTSCHRAWVVGLRLRECLFASLGEPLGSLLETMVTPLGTPFGASSEPLVALLGPLGWGVLAELLAIFGVLLGPKPRNMDSNSHSPKSTQGGLKMAQKLPSDPRGPQDA
jgi:hypothetical protein